MRGRARVCLLAALAYLVSDPMRIKAPFLILSFLSAAAALRAAPLERDLGEGLAYFRVHALPDDLPAARALSGRPCVLDVRYVRGDVPLGAVLAGWLKLNASPHSPVILLANRQTSPALLARFSSADAIAGLVIIGPAAPDFAPDIALPIAASRDRRAYEALEQGVSVSALLDDRPDKPRNDEARLARDHLTDAELNDAPADPDRPESKKAPPQLIDAVLQRAVQLHRSLLAMKRL